MADDTTAIVEKAFVTIKCGRHSINTEVLVFSMSSSCEALLGRDLLSHFGICIQGLPISFPDTDEIETPCGEDSLDETLIAEDPKQDVIMSEKNISAEIKDSLSDLLSVNESIDRAESCKLDYAIISLPVSSMALTGSSLMKIAT